MMGDHDAKTMQLIADEAKKKLIKMLFFLVKVGKLKKAMIL